MNAILPIVLTLAMPAQDRDDLRQEVRKLRAEVQELRKAVEELKTHGGGAHVMKLRAMPNVEDHVEMWVQGQDDERPRRVNPHGDRGRRDEGEPQTFEFRGMGTEGMRGWAEGMRRKAERFRGGDDDRDEERHCRGCRCDRDDEDRGPEHRDRGRRSDRDDDHRKFSKEFHHEFSMPDGEGQGMEKFFHQFDGKGMNKQLRKLIERYMQDDDEDEDDDDEDDEDDDDQEDRLY